MALNKSLLDELGAEPIEEVDPALLQELGAEPVEESPLSHDLMQELGAEPVEAPAEEVVPEEKKPGFLEKVFKGFKDRAAADKKMAEAQAQEQVVVDQARQMADASAKEREDREVEIRASPEHKKGFAGMVDSLKKFYRPDMTHQQLVDELSAEYQIDPREVEANFDELAKRKAQETGVYTQPTNEEMLNAVMIGTLPLAGAIAGPMAVAKGLASYTAIKEGAERVILPAAKIIAQKLSDEPVQYEVTKFREMFPDVGPVRDIADFSEFLIYGMGAHKATKFVAL